MFFGLYNVFRLFVLNFAHLAVPVIKIIRKNQPKQLGTLYEKKRAVAASLKEALIVLPFLALPRNEERYTLNTGAY